MIYAIESKDTDFVIKGRYFRRQALELEVKEKTIEAWIASHPELIFPKEQLFVIGRIGWADILALDSFGNLIIVGIEREWSDRTAVTRFLDEAASYKEDQSPYETLNQLARECRNWPDGVELIDKFREFADDPTFPPERLCRNQHVYIVAPEYDFVVKRIVEWLRQYHVPIKFIPFRLLADQNNTLCMIDISGVTTDMEFESGGGWVGHRIFNTNETRAPGTYQRMFDRGVIAIYGYENGGENLKGALSGDMVFAYVNGQGIRALGEVIDPAVRPGSGIFVDDNGNQQLDEYHLSVSWKVILPQEAALSNSEASNMGYRLPVRTVFERLNRGELASRLGAEIKRRAVS